MTPRHPPRALRSLTTPTRPRPARPRRVRPADARRPRSPPDQEVPRPRLATLARVLRRSQRHRTTRDVTPIVCGIREGPRSWMIHCSRLHSLRRTCHDHADLLRVSRHPDCQRAPAGVDSRRLAAGQGAGPSPRRRRPAPGGEEHRDADGGRDRSGRRGRPTFGRSCDRVDRGTDPRGEPAWAASRGGRADVASVVAGRSRGTHAVVRAGFPRKSLERR